MDKADTFETVHEHLGPAAIDDVMEEATDYDVAEEMLTRPLTGRTTRATRS